MKMIKRLICLCMALVICAGCAGSPEKAEVSITEDEAMEAVLKKVPGATEFDILSLHLDSLSDNPIYKGEMDYEDFHYNFQVDAVNGKVIQWDIEEN